VSDVPDPSDLEPDADALQPAPDVPLVDPSVFDNLVLDDDFIRGGVYEPPARTRDAIARHGHDKTSWRHGGGLNQPPQSRVPSKNADSNVAPLRKPKKPRGIRKFGKSQPQSTSTYRSKGHRREQLLAWLPAVTAIAVVVLVVVLGGHHSL
jgi:hypothetical protein